MYEKREWGEYTVLSFNEIDGDKVLTKHLTLLAGKHLSYQSHEKRSEQWTKIVFREWFMGGYQTEWK